MSLCAVCIFQFGLPVIIRDKNNYTKTSPRDLIWTIFLTFHRLNKSPTYQKVLDILINNEIKFQLQCHLKYEGWNNEKHRYLLLIIIITHKAVVRPYQSTVSLVNEGNACSVCACVSMSQCLRFLHVSTIYLIYLREKDRNVREKMPPTKRGHANTKPCAFIHTSAAISNKEIFDRSPTTLQVYAELQQMI